MRTLQVCRFRGLTIAALALAVTLATAGCDDLGTDDTSGRGDGTTVAEPTTGGLSETTDTTAPAVPTTAAPTTAAPTTVPPGPGTTLPPAVTVTTEALSSAEELLPGGHIIAMGFIDSVWVDAGGVRHIKIDYAEMLTTEPEKTEAARAAGDIGPTEVWDLDYYISNVNPLLREFVVSGSVAITTSTRWAPHDGMGAPCTWADFITFWGPGPWPEGETQLHAVPWWIERDGGTVVKIDEQYLP
jgi:hypothetical protein